MFKKVGIIIGVVLALFFIRPAGPTQGQVDPQHSDPVWQAYYWNNTTLTGPPALQREEGNLNYEWGYGSPDAAIRTDGFSARWVRYVDLPPGTYRFTATGDDGLRVWVDSNLIINEWYDHGPQTVSADSYIAAGHHLLMIEYYENSGGAVAKFSWTVASSNPTPTPTLPPYYYGWRATYYNNTDLSGNPVLTRDEEGINFDWGYGSPDSARVRVDQFSARWTRSLDLPAGFYRFAMTVDDGGRLWVNNHLLIEAWVDQSPQTYTGEIYLPGGAVPIKMEYYENGGGAVARLSWSSGSGGNPTPTPINCPPEWYPDCRPPDGNNVIVDDGDWGFSKGGDRVGWQSAYAGYGNHMTWTYNNDRLRSGYNWARWYPNLSPGRYELFVFIPTEYATTTGARYWVSSREGYTLRVVDQSANRGQWVSLGTYSFRGGDEDYLSLSDVTYETRFSRFIAFDAAKWEPR
jgi:hypothetical protein